MNRLISVLAGAVTAAMSGAVIAAAAVGQGVFDGSPTKSAASTEATAAVAVGVAPAVNPEPQIVYVDKEPVYITRTVLQAVAQNTDVPQPSASSTQPPTATPTQQPTAPAAQPAAAGWPPPVLLSPVVQPSLPVVVQAPAIPTPRPATAPTRTGDNHGDTHSTTTPSTRTPGRTSGHDD